MGSGVADGAGLVGRDPQVRVLTAALERLGSGEMAVLEITGEPGIGKTRLLDELVAQARRRSLTVWRGRATEYEREISFAALPPALGAAVGAPSRPDLRSRTEARADRLDVERYRTYRALCAALREAAATASVVVVVDDAHWADQATLEFLDHLLRRPVPGTVLAVAFRPRQAPPLLASAFAAPEVARVALTGLSETAAADLVGDRVPARDFDRLYRDSGGNPFYLQALAEAADLGDPATDRGSADAVGPPEMPAAVWRVLAQDLVALSPDEAALIRAAAVVGDPFDLDPVAAVAGLTPARAVPALDGLARRDLVRATDGDTRLRFRHPLVRHAVHQATDLGSLIEAHRNAAVHLRAHGAGPVTIAHHVARSAAPGDTAAIALLDEAARTVLAVAPATAASWWGVALRLLPDGPDRLARRISLMILRAKALATAGQLAHGSQLLHEVLRIVPVGNGALRAEVVGFCAMVGHLLGHYDEAATLVSAELRATAPGHPTVEPLTLGLATVDCFRADYATAHGRVAAVRSALPDDAGPARTASVDSLLAVTSLYTGDLATAAAARQRAVDAFARLTDDDTGPLLEHLAKLAWAHRSMHRHADAALLADRGVRLARASGQNHVLQHFLLCRASLLLDTGRLDLAGRLATDAEEVARLVASPHLLAFALALRSELVVWGGGDIAEAVRLGDRAVSLVADRPGLVAADVARVLSEASLAAGDPFRAEHVIRTVSNDDALPRFPASSRLMAHELLTRAALARGDRPAARQWARRAAGSPLVDLPGYRGYALRADAALRLGEDPAHAAALARQAAHCFHTAGLGIEEGRARLLAASALAGCGDLDAATTELGLVRQLGDHGAARRLCELAERERHRLAGLRRVHRTDTRPGDPLAALTDRQRQVADLVAEGLTNQQIATRLYVTRRTVEMHVHRILRLLGAGSRTAVATAVERSRRPSAAPPEASR